MMIKRACGHDDFTHSLIGKTATAEAIANEENQLCNMCGVAKIREERKAWKDLVNEVIAEHSIPLSGSEKQIKWATDIRSTYIKKFVEAERIELEGESIAEFYGDITAEEKATLLATPAEEVPWNGGKQKIAVMLKNHKIFAMVTKNTSAKWLIDNRFDLQSGWAGSSIVDVRIENLLKTL